VPPERLPLLARQGRGSNARQGISKMTGSSPVRRIQVKAKQSTGAIAMVTMLSLGVFALSLPADAADGQGKGHSRKGGSPAATRARPDKGGQAAKGDEQEARAERPKAKKGSAAVVIDQPGHRRIVQEFFATEALPPGLAKRQSLPPGLSRQLRENGRLPPGLQKRLTPVPLALGSRLPPVPGYCRRYFAGRDLVFVDTRTNRIVSVMRDIRP
jgi:hypothetical protein